MITLDWDTDLDMDKGWCKIWVLTARRVDPWALVTVTFYHQPSPAEMQEAENTARKVQDMIRIAVETPEHAGARKIDGTSILQSMREVLKDVTEPDFRENVILNSDIEVLSLPAQGRVRTTTLVISSDRQGEGKTILANEIKRYLETEGLKTYIEDETYDGDHDKMGARELSARKIKIMESDVHIRVMMVNPPKKRRRREPQF